MSEGELGRAPGGLGFVQAFVNTGYHTPEGGIDPFSDSDIAHAWLVSALTRYWPRAAGRAGRDGQPVVVLDPLDIERLRTVRLAVTELIAERHGSPALTADLRVGVDDDGRTVVESLGTGAGQVVGIVLSEILFAQQDGTWSRLKVCRNGKCAVAFYDRSPNASAVWHNAKVCGNAINLRRSRSRRRINEPE